MTYNQQKIYAVIYDRFIQKRFYTDMQELSEETGIKHNTFRQLFYKMNGKWFDVKRTPKGMRINDVQRISDKQSYW